MKLVCLTILVFGVAIIADRGAEAIAVPAPTTTPYKWEYRALTEVELIALTEAKTVEAGLNKLGEEGWELAGIRSSGDSTIAAKKNPQSLYCFKRLKSGK